jgi:metal-responsive CopG/Arc/MetJ family transcriptional regulator
MNMKTTISIPGPLFQAAERLAKRLGITRSRLYSRAIERYVCAAEERDVTALLNKVYEHESSELDPVLEALQALSIPREQW